MIRFVLENVSDAATLSTTPVITSQHVIDNVKKLGRNRFVRTVDADNKFTILGNLASAEDVSALVIARHNLSRKIAYRIKLFSADDQAGSTLYDSGLVQVSYKDAATALLEWGFFDWGSVPWEADAKDFDNRQWYDLVWWADQEGYPNGISGVKSFSIEFDIAQFIYCSNSTINCSDSSFDCADYLFAAGTLTDPGIPYYEIGRLYMGIYLEPAYNLSAGHGLSWVENVKQYRPNSGTLRSDHSIANRKFEFSLKTIPEADRADLHKKLIEKGKRKDFYVSLFHDDVLWDKDIDYSGLVKFTQIPKYTEFIHNYYKSNFVMEEI